MPLIQEDICRLMPSNVIYWGGDLTDFADQDWENAAHSGRHLPAYAVKCYLLER
jgi:hypothetical protein